MAALACGLAYSFAWLPVSRGADKTAADYFVSSLPGAPDGPLLKMHAGHIEVTPEHNGHLFFWHFQNRHIAQKQRTVIWLNGGPGCSSMDGAMMEIGPYRVVGDNLFYNEGSWDEFANVLFVDNPVGTGFSFVNTDSYVHELPEMADQFITFLEKWFDLFPEYDTDDIYIAGESYAGQHIPYIAKAMLERNHQTSKTKWSLKGLLIGNGWISPVDQYMAYLPYAYKMGLVENGSEDAQSVETQVSVCTNLLNEGAKDHVDTPACEQILQDILRVTRDHSSNQRGCVNMYDVRLDDDYPSCGMNWPPDLEDVTPYLRRHEVTQALHVDKDKRTGWQECSGAVGSQFRARESTPSIDLLPDLLEEMEITLFSGDQDLICNHLGTEELIHNMEWNGGKGFELSPGTWAPRRDWTFEGEAAGIYQSARNLTYVVFYNASHMVPFDYPRRSRDMLDRFMGVDISSIGGEPTDSHVEGMPNQFTSVGSHPNSTAAQEHQQDEVNQATWKAYYKSGEVALVIVVVAAGLWGLFVYRDRRRRAGYTGVLGAEPADSERGVSLGLDAFRGKRAAAGGTDRDVEAADFDENELENLPGDSDSEDGGGERERLRAKDGEMARERYSLGEASSSSSGSRRGGGGGVGAEVDEKSAGGR
ncbi:pheromone-processing carboxypeptidase kex1 [Lineolata rhizophorae]|uniref:Carboxypeptidase n=1 Tax=Lineolata rhizophorae TaxID=578093 RepID=A0A6A6PC01_9PEZI|nr:pheromone-processing carboxypeptidase kex1 [Lineolata rhizophorae]